MGTNASFTYLKHAKELEMRGLSDVGIQSQDRNYFRITMHQIDVTGWQFFHPSRSGFIPRCMMF
jgi:hypothetical protein